MFLMSHSGSRFFLASVALYWSWLAPDLAAATHYVCDCGGGSDVDCQIGDDGAPGTMINPWRSYEKARIAFGSLSAGDAIRFCQGGAWDIDAGTRWVNTSCRSTNRCTVGDYAAPWASGDEGRPILRRLDDSHGFALEDGGNAEHEEGYIFENLVLRGSGNDSGWGFFLYNDVDDVLIRNLSISGFAIGVHLAGSNACNQSDPVCDGQNDRIHLRDSSIFDNDRQGWLGASNGTQIVGNHFEANGSTAIFDHNIYVSGSSGGQTQGIRILNNTLFRSALDSQGVCRGVSLVVHGEHDDLLIEGNEVWEEVGLAGGGCWGVAVDNGYGSAEGFSNVIIAGNTIRNVGNLAIGVGACADCTIENNVIIHDQAFGVTAIAAPDRSLGTGDLVQDDITVRNNSIWIGPASGGTGISVRDMGNDHTIVSNAIHYVGNNNNFNCIRADLPLSSYTEIDNNICHFPNAGGAEWSDGFGTAPDPLSAWQSASGFGSGSQLAAPGFSDPVNLDLSADSAGAAMVDGGHLGFSTAVDHDGFSRDPLPDVGAWEWGVTAGIFADGFEAADVSAWSGSAP
jgi:hypothetical protein